MPSGTRTEQGTVHMGTPFAEPGEMRALCRTFEWAHSPRGSIDSWPPILRASGEPARGEGMPLVSDPDDAHDVAHFTFAFAALRDDRGAGAGLFITAIETTHRTQGERELRAAVEREANEDGARAEETLRESEAGYRTLFDSSDEGGRRVR